MGHSLPRNSAGGVYAFSGGPWHGFRIEYGEREPPARSVRPDAVLGAVAGIYLLNIVSAEYLWAVACCVE